MRNYELYMRDFLEENSPVDFSQLPEIEEIDEAGKEGVYKENYYFQENLQAVFVTPILAKRKSRDFIINFVGTFIDKHATQLSTSGPVYTFTFGEKELTPIYELFNIDNEQILSLYNNMNNETYGGQISKIFTGWVNNAPQKLLFTAMIADSYQNGYDDIIECCEYMYAFTEYPILYRHYWKLGVQEPVMNYTIEHLGNKYKIRDMANIQELLKYDSSKAVEMYKDKFIPKCADNVYMDLMYRMRNQITSKLKNIAHEYYKNIETNATQHTNVSVFDDGQIADQEGQSINIAAVVDKVTNKFISSGINKSMVRVSADARKLDKGTLEGMIAQIYSTKNNRINKIVEDIITVYFIRNPATMNLSSGEFLNFGISLYKSIGTSKDPLLVEIKGILSFWMNDIVNIKSLYQREATISNYTRGVFDYVVLMINYAAD